MVLIPSHVLQSHTVQHDRIETTPLLPVGVAARLGSRLTYVERVVGRRLAHIRAVVIVVFTRPRCGDVVIIVYVGLGFVVVARAHALRLPGVDVLKRSVGS